MEKYITAIYCLVEISWRCSWVGLFFRKIVCFSTKRRIISQLQTTPQTVPYETVCPWILGVCGLLPYEGFAPLEVQQMWDQFLAAFQPNVLSSGNIVLSAVLIRRISSLSKKHSLGGHSHLLTGLLFCWSSYLTADFFHLG